MSATYKWVSGTPFLSWFLKHFLKDPQIRSKKFFVKSISKLLKCFRNVPEMHYRLATSSLSIFKRDLTKVGVFSKNDIFVKSI